MYFRGLEGGDHSANDPSIGLPHYASNCVRPRVYRVIASNMFGLGQGAGSGFEQAKGVFSGVVQVVQDRERLTAIGRFVCLVGDLSMVEVVEMVVRPYVIIRVRFYRGRVSNVIIRLARFCFYSAFPLCVHRLASRRVPRLLKDYLFKRPSIFVFVLHVR